MRRKSERTKGERERERDRDGNDHLFQRDVPPQPGRNISRPHEMNHLYRLYLDDFLLRFLSLVLARSLGAPSRYHINRENVRAR